MTPRTSCAKLDEFDMSYRAPAVASSPKQMGIPGHFTDAMHQGLDPQPRRVTE
jgi:hypothetical protein